MHNPVCSAVRSLRTAVTSPQVFYFFPDEIVIDIISRLPAKTALRCRCVCRKWRDLTWTRDFLDLHLRRGAPMIIFQRSSSKLFLFCNWWNHARLMTWLDPARPTTHEFGINMPPDTEFYYDFYQQIHSYDGIIVLKEHSRCFMVHNPIYGECVRISFAKNLIGCHIYEVFFHPSLKEYCTLWQLPEEVDYRMLNLGPNPCWRKVRNPSKYINPSPVGRHHPLYLDGYLYWMVEENDHFEIAELDINTEVYAEIPLPETVEWQNMLKLKIHNHLSLVGVSSIENIVHVNVWTLTDRALKYWTNSSYNINLEVSPDHTRLEVLAVWDGELFLQADGEHFVCNLKTGTATRTTVCTQFAEEEEDNIFTFFYPHAMNLDTLRNCKSEIFMNKEGLKPWRVVKDNGFRYW